MFSIPHIVIIFIVVLVVFGPHKLPELARSLGKMMAEFRKASTDFKMAFEEEMRTIERQARESEWKKSQEAAAAASTGEAQPATLATADVSETPRILPESIASSEPTITRVSESIARDAHNLDTQTIDTAAVPPIDGSESLSEAPAADRPASDNPNTNNDQRQSA
jgi:sec-independent protein translocase protein TatB